MHSASFAYPCLLFTFLLAGCSANGGLATSNGNNASAAIDDDSADKWAIIAKSLHPGTLTGNVYSVVIPRNDLQVTHIDFGDIPLAAGLESQFHFFLCSCGKAFFIGQLCVVDDEANSVIDELRAAHIQIASMAPMLIGDKPRILILHVQGEGEVEDLSAGLTKALHWMRREKTK